MFSLSMTLKGFTDQHSNIETPNDIIVTEKPLKTKPITHNRVDINVLKSMFNDKLIDLVNKLFRDDILLYKKNFSINPLDIFN